jgi:integrase
MSDLHIKDDILEVEQNKTGQKLRLQIIGELKVLIDAMAARKKNHKVHTLALICTETGRPLTYAGLRSRFDKARIKAAKENPRLKDAIEAFQFRDLRAKAATDKAESGSMHQAQKQLGHTTIVMTEHYVRDRRGATVTPTK